MLKLYRRVTLEDRYLIDAGLRLGKSRSCIAQELGFHKSTIIREIRRNFSGKTCTPTNANRRAVLRYRNARKPYKLKDEVARVVLEKLKLGWTPDHIAGRMKNETFFSLSHQAIYNFTKKHPELRVFLKFNRRRGAGRLLQRKSRIKNGLSIKERPASANHRSRMGHWERDTAHFKCSKKLVVMVERKSRFTKIEEVKNLSRSQIYKATKTLYSLKKKVISITNDNGSEFKDNERYKTPIYYCDPLKPHQRGTVENTIGLIRTLTGKLNIINPENQALTKSLETLLNHRPRKCLGYKTPYEVFYNKRVALVC